MKWLEELLNEVEGKDEIIKGIKTNLAKEFVPKLEFNNKLEEIKELKSQVTERDTQLRDLKENVNGDEDLTKKIEQLELENKKAQADYEFKLTALQKKEIASKHLLENKARDLDVILPLLKLDEFELSEDGKELVGFTDKLKEHKETYSYLYDDGKSTGWQGFKPTDTSNDEIPESSIGKMFASKKNNNQSEVDNSLWK